MTIRYPQLGVEAFLSTPSGWRATLPDGSTPAATIISIHALRVEGDKRLYCFGVLKAYFYPRPPGGGRPGGEFPTLPAGISIHALRVEGDLEQYPDICAEIEISIHALRVEGDVKDYKTLNTHNIFLSTPSGWRATSAACSTAS